MRSPALEQSPPSHLTRVAPRALRPSRLAPACPSPPPPSPPLFSAAPACTTPCMALSEPGEKVFLWNGKANISPYLTLDTLKRSGELWLSIAPSSCVVVQVNEILLEEGSQCFPTLWQANHRVVRLRGGRRQGRPPAVPHPCHPLHHGWRPLLHDLPRGWVGWEMAEEGCHEAKISSCRAAPKEKRLGRKNLLKGGQASQVLALHCPDLSGRHVN